MSTPKHTPGPWVAHPFQYGSDDPRWRVIQLGSSGGSAGLAVVHPRRNAQGVAVEANAHLIAAAPELLAALQQARDYIAASAPTVAESLANPDTGLIDSGEGLLTMGVVYELIAQIEATIAKATGQPT